MGRKQQQSGHRTKRGKMFEVTLKTTEALFGTVGGVERLVELRARLRMHT